MSAQIADFTLRFNAESAQFQKDVDYAKKMLRGYTTEAKAANDSNGSFTQSLEASADKAKSAGSNFLKLTSAVAGSVSAVAAATGYLITQQADQAREIERMATVSGLAVEEIQALGYASEQYSISGDKMADILKDTQDKLGDFVATGGGEFKDFFEQVAPKVGLTADELSKLSGPDVLVAVKEAMDSANVPMKQQIFYLESIANDASALMPLLENKGKKLNELTGRYNDLNVAMSEFDIKNFKEMDQKLGDVALKVEKSFATAVVGAREQIDWLTDQLTFAVSWWGELFDSWSDDPQTRGGLVKRLADIRSEIKPLEDELKSLQTNLDKLDETTSDGNPWGEHQRKIYQDQIDKVKAEIEPLKAERDKLQTDYGKRYLGLNVDPPKPTSGKDTGTGSGGDEPNDPAPLTDTSRLDSLDMQLASERQRINLAREQQLAEIEAFNFAEKDVRAKGYQSLDELQQDYIDKTNASFNEQIEEHDRLQDAAIQRELDSFIEKERKKTEEAERAAKQRADTEKRLNDQILSMQFQVANQALGIIADSAEEGSDLQKAAFLAQQTMSAAQVFISGEVAAMAALDPVKGLGPIAGAGYAGMIRGMAAASAGMIMGQAISGMAHNGMDYIPDEGTWLLDKGERVYTNESARQIDLMYSAVMSMQTRALAASDSLYNQIQGNAATAGSGGLTVEQHFHMDSSTNQETAKQTAQLMEQKVIEVLSNQMRPGGMLSR